MINISYLVIFDSSRSFIHFTWFSLLVSFWDNEDFDGKHKFQTYFRFQKCEDQYHHKAKIEWDWEHLSSLRKSLRSCQLKKTKIIRFLQMYRHWCSMTTYRSLILISFAKWTLLQSKYRQTRNVSHDHDHELDKHRAKAKVSWMMQTFQT